MPAKSINIYSHRKNADKFRKPLNFGTIFAAEIGSIKWIYFIKRKRNLLAIKAIEKRALPNIHTPKI
jgi:hypothetical protein